MPKTNKEIRNCLYSDLSNYCAEFPENESVLLSAFSQFLEDADVDTDIIIAVLEKYGCDEALDLARDIKVKYGY